MTEEIEAHVLKKYEILQKLGKYNLFSRQAVLTYSSVCLPDKHMKRSPAWQQSMGVGQLSKTRPDSCNFQELAGGGQI